MRPGDEVANDPALAESFRVKEAHYSLGNQNEQVKATESAEGQWLYRRTSTD